MLNTGKKTTKQTYFYLQLNEKTAITQKKKTPLQSLLLSSVRLYLIISSPLYFFFIAA